MDTPVFDQIKQMQAECLGENPPTIESIILGYYPNLGKNFVKRQMFRILALSPDDLVRLIGYPDPTGEKAVRNVMRAEAVAA